MDKRLLISTILGVLFGFVCFGLASSSPEPLGAALATSIILGRTLIGIGIGISRVSMGHWAIHGLVIGLIFSLPAAFSAILGATPEFPATAMFWTTLLMGGVYGLLIELITTLLFKAKQA